VSEYEQELARIRQRVRWLELFISWLLTAAVSIGLALVVLGVDDWLPIVLGIALGSAISNLMVVYGRRQLQRGRR
jgi:hypothetical protein